MRHLAISVRLHRHFRGTPCKIELAQARNAELVAADPHFGVTVHMHERAPELPMQAYARDSTVMTPYGANVTSMAQWWRRAENNAAVRPFERLGIPISDTVPASNFECGHFVIIEERCLVMGCGGARTQEEGARQVGSWFVAERGRSALPFLMNILMNIPCTMNL